MQISERIEQKISEQFTPRHMELINESHMHAGPATESHFKLILVADQFADLSKVRRHQMVYRALSEELAGPVHALALHLFAPGEWEGAQSVPQSPDCAG